MAAGRARKWYARGWPVIVPIAAAALMLVVALAGYNSKFLPASRGISTRLSALGSYRGATAGRPPVTSSPVPSARSSGAAPGGSSPGATTKGQTPSAANTGGSNASTGSGGSGGTASAGGGSGSSGSAAGGVADPCMIGTWVVSGFNVRIGGSYWQANAFQLGFGVTSNTFSKTINANGSFTENFISLSVTNFDSNPPNGVTIAVSGLLSGSVTTTADAQGSQGQEGQEVATYTSGEVTASNGSNVTAAMTGNATFNCNGNIMSEYFSGSGDIMTRVTS